MHCFTRAVAQHGTKWNREVTRARIVPRSASLLGLPVLIASLLARGSGASPKATLRIQTRLEAFFPLPTVANDGLLRAVRRVLRVWARYRRSMMGMLFASSSYRENQGCSVCPSIGNPSVHGTTCTRLKR
jgi:hypothetical protein